MTDDVIQHEPAPLAALSPASMPELFKLAVEKGGVDALERLAALHERMMDRDSAREFAAAMAAFQEECPPVPKTSTAKVTTKSGGQYAYQYAELDEIARTVRPILHKHGLSYSWDSALSEGGGMLEVVCTIAHSNGHKTTAKFTAPTEALTQAMSPQQRHAAALTFGRRQTLIQALGLTTTDPDSEAREEDSAVISPAQVEVLEELIGQRPPGARKALLAWLSVETMEQVPASRYEYLVSDLKAKIAASKK